MRRAYAAERVWAALRARASGRGHRRVGVEVGVPAATVRGWLRRAAGRLEAIRIWFMQVAVTVGVEVAIPDGSGCAWRDVLAAVTPPQVVVAASGGRLLAPGWPAVGGATPIAPDAAQG